MALRIPAMLLIVSWMGVLHLGEALWLNVPPSKAKCLSEEIKGNANVLGKYNVISNDPDHSNTIDAKVTSPSGNVVYNVKNVTHGQFSFTTTEPGNYLTCFWMDGYNRDVETTVNLDWRKGLAARDWGYVAKIEKLEGVELELRKHEELVETIKETMLILRNRGMEMRILNETTNSRLSMFSIMSLGICILVSALQLWHLKRYFRKKLVRLDKSTNLLMQNLQPFQGI